MRRLSDLASLPPDEHAAFLAELGRAVEAAHIPALMAALVHLTGDVSPVEQAPQPVYGLFTEDQGNLPADLQAKVRRSAVAAVANLLKSGKAPPQPSDAAIHKMMRFVVGAELPERYMPLLAEQLAMDAADPMRPDWSTPRLRAAAKGLHVVIIGAGMSGLLMGLRLKQAGIGFRIIEKGDGVGGVWRDNVYPGCRVDTPSHLYSYSFEQNHAWPAYYSTQDVLLNYFERIADDHGLRAHIETGTEVTAAVFDEETARWSLSLRGRDGEVSRIEADHVVAAVGQLNQPRYPQIAGLGDFDGPAFHSARWDRDVALDGKRVGVIGTGASAFQFVPEIADKVDKLVLFQRSPPWLSPTPDYHDTVPGGDRWLFENLPFYEKWYRFRQFWKMSEGKFDGVIADPAWQGPPSAIGEASEFLRKLFTDATAAQCEGADGLLDLVIPDYPVGGKRALRDNGVWIRTLRRPNVEIVAEPIEAITERGLRTKDGREHAVDVLIYGTGFHASDFLRNIEVRGRGGVELHDVWDGDARAFLGVTVPDFPNFFMLYGPNTNVVVNGSIIFMTECAVNHVMACLKLAAEHGSGAIEVRPEVYGAYNREVDEANAQRAWGVPQSQSWYKNAKGRVSQNWPHRLIEYWSATRSPSTEEFILGEADGALRTGRAVS